MYIEAIAKIRRAGWARRRTSWDNAKAESPNFTAMGLTWLLILCGLIYTTHVIGGGLPDMSDKERVLEQQNPEIRYNLKELDRSAGEKFLLFDIFQVVNPAAIPLAFTVHYQKPGQDRVYLGGFALYPADNPGRFIVPIQGKVGKDGEILLKLASSEMEKAAQPVQVKLREVKLIDQLDP